MSGPAPEGPAVTRAARLARLRAATSGQGWGADAATAARAGGTLAAVLCFPRPAALEIVRAATEVPCDLDRLPGAGPGLVWALRQAGFSRRADLAPLAPEDLAACLGPLGALAPTATWIAAARNLGA
jgi:predicted flap endonuclease-1-like 5' DNA nuclease